MTDDFGDIVKEIKVMRQCHSPHIVKYYGKLFHGEELWVRLPPPRPSSFSLFLSHSLIVTLRHQIIMEFCHFGSLSDLIAVAGARMSELQIAWVVLCGAFVV